MTQQESIAIRQLQQAIRHAHSLGIRLAGMDGQLLYATKSAYKKGLAQQKKEEKRLQSCYSAVAHAQQVCDDDSVGTLDEQCYEDSGGW